jgi:hypothetical protein
LRRGRCTWSIKGQNHLGLVNRNGVSIHHVTGCALICPVAFILDKRQARMVNPWCVLAHRAVATQFPA